jgi:Na+/phosphate symporter
VQKFKARCDVLEANNQSNIDKLVKAKEKMALLEKNITDERVKRVKAQDRLKYLENITSKHITNLERN